MKQPRGKQEYGKNGCCPTDWERVPNMTGDHILDGSIMRCRNKDAHARLEDHLAGGVAYQIRTGYNSSTID